MVGIKYLDGNGDIQIKNFKTETLRDKWIDKNHEDIEILAYCD